MAKNQEPAIHAGDYWRVVKKHWPTVLAIFVIVVSSFLFLVVTTAYFYTKTIPKIYESSAVINVAQEYRDIDRYKFAADSYQDMSMFMSVFEVIQSKPVLNRVIKRLGLQNIFSQMNGMASGQLMTENQAYDMLRQGMLSVQPYRNTQLIEIRVSGTDSALAMLIANFVAEEYESYCMEEINTRTESGLARAKVEMEKQMAAVERAKKKVEKLRKELGPDADISGGEVLTVRNMDLKLKEAQLSDMKTDVLARKVRFNKIKDLSPRGLEAVLPSLGLEDSSIATTKQNLYSNQNFLKSLEKEGFESDYRRIKSTQAKITELRVQLDRLLIGVRRSLEIDLEVSKAKMAGLEAEIVVMRERCRGNPSDKLAAYEDAVRDLDTLNAICLLYITRYKHASVDSICATSPVTLVSAAKENFRPVRPNLALNLGLAAIGGLVLGVSLAVLVSLIWVFWAYFCGTGSNPGKTTLYGPR